MTLETEVLIEEALEAVRDELLSAMEKFPSFRSAHEGVAVIDEELAEFRETAYWPHKFLNGAEETEVTQLAAMAVRYLIDICYKEDAPR